MRRAVFVAYESHLADSRGGVQVCTAEYIRVLKAAGFDLTIVPVQPDRAFSVRAFRKLNGSPYWRPMRNQDQLAVARTADFGSAEFIFFNQVALAGALDAIVRLEQTPAKKVLLSHGCEVTDQAHIVRLNGRLPLTGRLRPSYAIGLGQTLRDEINSRRLVDAVVTLSPFDAMLETWIGVERVAWIPRLLTEQFLPWKPISGRFGFVGTLDHAPNLEGLIKVLENVERRGLTDISIRIAGGPESIGHWLGRKFSSADYVGPLDDCNLKSEAATWTAFLHPIFGKARGCSTKLATGLSWGLPIVTTEEGRRGYMWSEGTLPETSDPQSFVDIMYSLHDPIQLEDARRQTLLACQSAPGLQENAEALRLLLSGIVRSVPTPREPEPI